MQRGNRPGRISFRWGGSLFGVNFVLSVVEASVVTPKFINHLRPSFTFLPRWDLPYGRP